MDSISTVRVITVEQKYVVVIVRADNLASVEIVFSARHVSFRRRVELKGQTFS
jgi:hypothetical protein